MEKQQPQYQIILPVCNTDLFNQKEILYIKNDNQANCLDKLLKVLQTITKAGYIAKAPDHLTQTKF